MNSIQPTGTSPQTNSSWLAFGCCAPHPSGDERRLVHGANKSFDYSESVCYEQPRQVDRPYMDAYCYGPRTRQSHMPQWASSGRDLAARASSRSRQGLSQIRARSRSRNRKVPLIISPPTDFRRGNHIPRRRRSFRPLELSIYMPSCRLSPLPDFSCWDELPEGLSIPRQALLREPSISSTRQDVYDDFDGETGETSPEESLRELRCMSIGSDSTLHDSLSLPAADPASFIFPEPPRSAVVNRPRRSSSLAGSALASPLPSLSSPPPSAGRFRIRSNTSPASTSRPRGQKSSKGDIDEAIRELNTIVEERRLDAIRSGNGSRIAMPTAPHAPGTLQHIPAIAPAMRVRARSETLSDIGSALSTPLGPKRLHPAAEAVEDDDTPSEVGTVDDETELDATPSDSRPGLRKFPQWLKRTPSVPSLGPTSAHDPPQPFYQCIPPGHGIPLQPLHSPSHHQPTRMALRGNPVSPMHPGRPRRRTSGSSIDSVDSLSSLPSLSPSSSPSMSENATMVTSPCSPAIGEGGVVFPLPPTTSAVRLAKLQQTEEQERQKVMLSPTAHDRAIVGLAF
ncbi:hypothetical protein P152DRAFT_450309 [Eremomyces bilateralis CBS 781.70]|uniref:Uncharacterized protein n=1 Tax=Eremomyces bilateralis CBS 781.70 TaxID=1392243 RepID=A0A6G1G1D9_9PEZI|nr:uncharacterized protein P152DRAFT_450309 [Eremomyces bilateralis CBS 781.70]KAF1811619.1 hypothetical protein P152DRAFT_450309 [Eremomyces bilateralis CBS 781.70]